MTAVHSVALMGLTGHVVEIEAWVGGGHPRTQLVGLPDAALSESQHRCRAAVSSQKLEWPDQFVTINLTPARQHLYHDVNPMADTETPETPETPEAAAAASAPIAQRLFDARTIIISGEITQKLAARVMAELLALSAASATEEKARV